MQSNLFISNSKKTKRFIKVTVFILILALAIGAVDYMLSVKANDGVAQWNAFYDIDKDTLDVLTIGSSHAYVNINPVVMYEKQGIASFNLCASMQPMWNSYYFFKEALKYQKPDLLILEGYGTCYSDDYSEYGGTDDPAPRIIKNNYGMKWSLNKIQSLVVSAPKGRKLEFILGINQYHNRYEEVNAWDFYDLAKYPEGETWRGQADRAGVWDGKMPDDYILEEPGYKELSPKTEEYYRKILSLAKKEGVPVLVLVTPYMSVKADEKRMFNTARDIAYEYGADFVDFNTRQYYYDIGLDFESDFVDVVHMNYVGNEKFSKFLADYLVSEYNLTDRRGNEVYEDWEKEIEVRRLKIQQIENNEGA